MQGGLAQLPQPKSNSHKSPQKIVMYRSTALWGGPTPHRNLDFGGARDPPKKVFWGADLPLKVRLMTLQAREPASQSASQHRGSARLFLSRVVRTRSAHTVSHYVEEVTIRGGALRAPPVWLGPLDSG